MTYQNSRSLFLNEFTKELILNSKREPKLVFPFHPTFLPAKLMTSQIQEVPAVPSITPLARAQIQPLPMKVQPYPRKIMPQQTPPLTQIPIPATIANIFPGAYPLPQNFTLNKLDMLILDTRVASIECQGPEKPVLIRSLGMVTPTKINLNEEEIRAIVKTFADAARIPLIGGVFKVAVGNLIMTAVLSDFVGSRFIINKYNPYSMPSISHQVPLK